MPNDPSPQSSAPIVPAVDTLHAPIIFFDEVPTSGHANGIFNLTLAASRAWVNADGAVVTDHVVVAYLKGDAQALLSLQQAIERAALIALPTVQEAAS